MRQEDQPPSSPRDPTAASTVLRSEQLRSPGTSSADLLSRVPGVQVRRTGAASDLATASLRGASSAQTPVYLAGVRLNDDVTGTADLSTVPLWMLDRAEVFRGNAPAHADRLGLGGAVFFEPRLPRRTELSAGLLMGSFATVGNWASGAVAGPGASALLSLRRDRARNDYSYRNDRGTVFVSSDDDTQQRLNADHEAYDSWAIGRFQLGRRARVTTVVNAFDREQGVTGLAVVPALRSRAHVGRELGAISARMPCHGSHPESSSCSLELATSALAARLAIDDRWQELGLQTEHVDSRGTRVSQTARAQFAVSPRVTLGLGAAQAYESLHAVYQGRDALRAGRQVTRLSTTAQLDAADEVVLFALAAAQREATSAPSGGQDWERVFPTGRTGVKLLFLPWLTVLGNLGRYARVPTLGELYGVSPLVRGNDQLVPEVGFSCDLGVRVAASDSDGARLGGYFEAFGYRRQVTDLVSYQRTSFRQVRPYNVSSARLQGAELAAGGVGLGVLRVRTAVSLLDPRDTTPGRSYENDILPYHSRLVLSQRVEVFSRLARAGFPVSYASAAAGVMHRSSQHQNAAGLGPIPRQTTLEVEGTARMLDDHLALRVLIANLLNAAHYDVVGLPLPGRAVHASAEVTWW